MTMEETRKMELAQKIMRLCSTNNCADHNNHVCGNSVVCANIRAGMLRGILDCSKHELESFMFRISSEYNNTDSGGGASSDAKQMYSDLKNFMREAADVEAENRKRDMINPEHYKVHANECIDEIKAMLTPEEFRGFLKGNLLKYRYRTGHKDDPEQEAKKSDWYMNRLIKEMRMHGNE